MTDRPSTGWQLQICSLAQRDNVDSILVNKIARRRELQFRLCMRRLVSSYIQDDEAALKDYQRLMTSILARTDEALVAKFRRLMQAWESDKAGSLGSVVDPVVDPEAGASESLKVPSAPTVATPSGLDPPRSSLTDTEAFQSAKSLMTASKETQMVDGLAKTLANTFIKSTTASSSSSSRTSATKMPSQKQNAELLNTFVTHQNPCESNAYGVETGDGVLVGHPPPYPPGLLDWESPEDNEEFDELVSNRMARTRTNSTSSARPDSDEDEEWICL